MDFYLFHGLKQIAILAACCGAITVSVTGEQVINTPCISDICQTKQGVNQSTSEVQPEKEIQLITVQILSNNDSIGSGVLIYKKDHIYTVITNAHVLRAGQSPYQIKTPDGEKYTAKLSQEINLGKNDLGLLQFKSKNNKNYSLAKIGRSSEIKEGAKVFVGGFPSKIDQSYTSLPPLSKNGLQGFVVKGGMVALVLNKPLEEGYQIGYTNEIRKGMSGGPVLNNKAELIGINGLHQDPLWDAPDLFQDGSTPCAPLQTIITKSSWSIPIDTVVKLLPQSWELKPVNVSQNITNINSAPNRVVNSSPLQKQAELAKKCQYNYNSENKTSDQKKK